MTEGAFSQFLLPGEKIVWTAENEPAPRSWRSGLAMTSVGLFLLATYGPRLLSILQACFQDRTLVPLRFMSFGGVMGLFLPVMFAAGALWLAAVVIRQRGKFTYGLSETRTFIADFSPKGGSTAISVIKVAGTLTVSQKGSTFTLSIPICHTGEDDAAIEFQRISKTDADAAFAIVNKIVGASPK